MFSGPLHPKEKAKTGAEWQWHVLEEKARYTDTHDVFTKVAIDSGNKFLGFRAKKMFRQFVMRTQRNSNQGFTLVEVLLVSAMFAVISLAVFNAFANGFKLWARGQHVLVEGDIAIFLDRFAEDLRQTAIITGISFKGNEEEIAFPAIIRAPADDNGSRAKEGIVAQLGAIRYTYDSADKKIMRQQAVYGQAIKGQWSDPLPVADLIESISMQYYFKVDKGIEAKSEIEEGIPMGVSVDVRYLVEGQTFDMKRFLIIPVGGGV